MDSLPQPPLRGCNFACPICDSSFTTRKQLLDHLRTEPDPTHKTLRFNACASSHYPQLLQQGVLACPLGCGSFFNGGETGTSKPLEFHIGRANCVDRRPTAPAAELNGPYLATTITGVRASLTAQARSARSAPATVPPHSAAVDFCCSHPEFTPIHMRTSGCQSAVSLPKPCLSTITPVITDLLNKAADVRGEVLREAAWDALFLFPTLVLGPQKPGASTTAVKAEMTIRLDLWNKGELDILAARAKAASRPPSGRSKSQRAARRAAQLLKKNQFARAAALAGSLGVADATEDTLKAIPHLFPEPGGVSQADLMDLYGPAAPPLQDPPSNTVTVETLTACLAAAPPLSSPHRDGWRNEHFVDLAKDGACGVALARVLTAIIQGDVSQKTANILSSSTLIVLLKKDADQMQALKDALGDAYLQPQRPIGMGTALVKLACNCALTLVKEALGPAVGPGQFAVETKGGCALLQWAIQMAMEGKPHLAGASLDGINAYGEIERDCIEAALRANPFLHNLLPLFDLLYKKGEGVLWFYDEHGNFVMETRNKRGVRQGCVLGMFLFCLAMVPVYDRLKNIAGEEGVVYAYCDDSYILAPVDQMAQVLHQAPGIFGKVGLRIGYGPGKTELVLPKDCSREAFPYPLDDPLISAPQVVTGFGSCLGVPRHPTNDPTFIHSSLQKMGEAHDRLLDLVEEVSDEDPFAALRLLQMCGVQKFGHVLSAVPPDQVREFAAARDEAIAATFSTIQQSPAPDHSTHTLPVGAGGAGLPSLAAHADGSYVGAFFRIAGPLQQRLCAMGGQTNSNLAASLQYPEHSKNSTQWANSVIKAHAMARDLQQSFSPAEQHAADRLAPRGSAIFSAGDPTSEVPDLPPTIDTDDFPEIHQATSAPKGIRFVASRIRKWRDWRDFFDLHSSAPARDQPKLLTHAGHGSVTILQSDRPLGQLASAEVARTTIRRISGASSLGRHSLTAKQHCPQCGVQGGEQESLERHVVRCPNGGMRHLFHAGLVGVIKDILKEAAVPDASVVVEARGLRPEDKTRPGDIVAFDFFAEGRHLVIDAVMTTVYRNTVLSKVATIPGYVAKQAEDRKFLADRTSSHPVSAVHGGPHILVPFAIEDGGRLGAHALALLRALATAALAKGRTPPFAKGIGELRHNMLVSLWVRRWQQRISTWLHLAISRHTLRLLCPRTAAQHGHL
jgi:hypothetical protein